MLISATVTNAASRHEVVVRTGESAQTLAVSAKSTGNGWSVNGGEFLNLAMPPERRAPYLGLRMRTRSTKDGQEGSPPSR